jgi:hypothetical protein
MICFYFYQEKKDINMCIQCTLKQRIDESSNTVEREAIETLLSIGNVLNSKDYCTVYKALQEAPANGKPSESIPTPRKESKLAMVSFVNSDLRNCRKTRTYP